MNFPAYVLTGMIIVFVLILFWLLPVPVWLKAKYAGVDIALLELLFMRFRRVRPSLIVDTMVKANQAGIPLRRDLVEAHYLSGGNIEKVVTGLIRAKNAGTPLDFTTAAAVDLTGRDLFEFIETPVNLRSNLLK